MKRNRGRTLIGWGALAFAAVASYAIGQGSTVDEIA
jgi:hypothetical protein